MSFFRETFGDRDKFEAEARHMLLERIIEAFGGKDQREADRVLVQTTRWLTTYPEDAVILEARKQLRIKFSPLHYSNLQKN